MATVKKSITVRALILKGRRTNRDNNKTKIFIILTESKKLNKFLNIIKNLNQSYNH